jgi:hypothetical protein
LGGAVDGAELVEFLADGIQIVKYARILQLVVGPLDIHCKNSRQGLKGELILIKTGIISIRDRRADLIAAEEMDAAIDPRKN